MHEALSVCKTSAPSDAAANAFATDTSAAAAVSSEAQRGLMRRTRLLRLCCCGKQALVRSMVAEISRSIRAKG